VGYLCYPKDAVQIRPSILRIITLIHNGGLALFSLYTFVTLNGILWKTGLVIQSEYYFQIPEFRHIIFLFYLSKYYEYIDTFILYAQRKTPIFLQTFHLVGAVI
jgi:hypothetical protein